MKLLFLADLHNVDFQAWQTFIQIDHVLFDVLILLGDIDTLFYKSIVENFGDKLIFGVHGNHDYSGDLEYYGINNLHGKRIELKEISICGIEGCVRYKKGEDAPMYTQEEIITLCTQLQKSDIIISHNSPFGIHDKAGIAHEGYKGLINYMDDNNPSYCIHGHQHENIVSFYKNIKIIGVYGGIILDTVYEKITPVLTSSY